MNEQLKQIELTINPKLNISTEELQDLTLDLQRSLLELDLETENINLAKSGELSESAKAGDPITWGTVLVLVGKGVIQGVSTAIVSYLVTQWLTQRRERNDVDSVTMKTEGNQLKLTSSLSPEEEEKIKELSE
jgi:hypothetical protein